MPTFVVNLIVSFLLRQFAKLEAQINWATVEAEIDDRIRKAVPEAMINSEIITLVNGVIEAFKKELGNSAQLKQLLELVAGEKWEDALSVLKAIAVDAGFPV